LSVHVPIYTDYSRLVKNESGIFGTNPGYRRRVVTDQPPRGTTSDQLLAISLRLKAARFLAGREVDGRAVAMTVPALAEHELLQRNGITKNRLEDYEQMKVTDPRPMELEKIAEALDVPAAFILDGAQVDVADRPSEQIERLEDQQRQLNSQLAEIVRLLTNDPEAKASLGDTIARIVEEAMTQRGEKVGLRGRRPPPPQRGSEQQHAA
jgi:transcriptional regulator with XRE-family HTH domain